MTLPIRQGLFVLASCVLLSACAGKPARMSEHECMTRVMYFESNRSSEEGMVAVGTVVMNRVNSKEFPNSVCGVVGQKNQFAPGVLSKKMGAGRELASKTATKVLRGARHSDVGRRSMFFHTAGYSFPYTNMHYVAIAGGNAFYEKRKDAYVTQDEVRRRTAARVAPRPTARSSRVVASAPTMRAIPAAAPAARPVPAPAPSGMLAPMSIEDILRADAAR